ncbi:hypothetical protein BV22DRAFT_1041498 [Leucogyrophana mollusca]|uniref:Uncharacterized protein n=1 Tax=Leucogyrophana mollusca TaxID=85980 RepID=A0ACB8AZG7_9AGAM|nr:hypothetical protein BV22DRAFT_1041498 [Leucogyrophana mollusca]
MYTAAIPALLAATLISATPNPIPYVSQRHTFKYAVGLYQQPNYDSSEGYQYHSGSVVVTHQDSFECDKCVPINRPVKSHLMSFWFEPDEPSDSMGILFYKDPNCKKPSLATYYNTYEARRAHKAVFPATAFKFCYNVPVAI